MPNEPIPRCEWLLGGSDLSARCDRPRGHSGDHRIPPPEPGAALDRPAARNQLIRDFLPTPPNTSIEPLTWDTAPGWVRESIRQFESAIEREATPALVGGFDASYWKFRADALEQQYETLLTAYVAEREARSGDALEAALLEWLTAGDAYHASLDPGEAPWRHEDDPTWVERKVAYWEVVNRQAASIGRLRAIAKELAAARTAVAAAAKEANDGN